jgi:hypothetical protein
MQQELYGQVAPEPGVVRLKHFSYRARANRATIS